MNIFSLFAQWPSCDIKILEQILDSRDSRTGVAHIAYKGPDDTCFRHGQSYGLCACYVQDNVWADSVSVSQYSFTHKDKVACCPCSRTLPREMGPLSVFLTSLPALTLLLWLPVILSEEQSQDLDQLPEPLLRLVSTSSHFPEECTYDLLRLRVKAPSLVKNL